MKRLRMSGALGEVRRIAGAEPRMGVLGRHRLTAVGAHHRGLAPVPAAVVVEDDRRPLLTAEPAVAPAVHSGQNTEEVPAHLGEHVVVPHGVRLIGPLLP